MTVLKVLAAVYATGFLPVAAIGTHTHWDAYHRPVPALAFGALCGAAWPATLPAAIADTLRGRP